MLSVDGQIPDWLRQMGIILEELNESVVAVESSTRVVFVNDALLRLGGYQRGEIVGKTPDCVFPPQDLPYLMQQRELAEPYKHHCHKFYIPRKDGEKIPVIYSGRMIQGPDSREYRLGILTDISSQKRIEDELRQSNALLGKSQKEIEDELRLAARVQPVPYSHLVPKHTLAAVERLDASTGESTDTTTDTDANSQSAVEMPVLQQLTQ